jgi:hypothetical protein
VSRHFAQTVTRLRAPLVTDRYNNRVPDWPNAARTDVAGVNLQPAGSPPDSDEDTVDRQVAVTGWRLYTPPGMDLDLLATDRIEYGGRVLEVVGEVGRWEVAGRVHHVEVYLREVT